MVFHLEVVAYNTRFGDLIERDSFYSGVYGTLKKAVEEGLWFINRRFKDIYQQSDYCTNEKDSLTLEDMIEDKMIYYNFTVTKLSPYYADNFETPGSEYKCKNLRPTHTILHYDYRGNLKYKDIQYLNKDGGIGYVIKRYKDDDENKPNKFNIGDFVTVINEDIPKDQVFVVSGVPRRNDPMVYFENTYCLSTITNGCKFEFCHDYNESKLLKYDGVLDKNSPLILLQKYYRDEIEIDEEIMKKIELNEIILNIKPTYMDISQIREVLNDG